VLASIKRFLASKFGIGHSTVQLEPGACADERPDRCIGHEAR
jgi:hypothetical protein